MWGYFANIFNFYSSSTDFVKTDSIEFGPEFKPNAIHIESWYIQQKNKRNFAKWITNCQNHLRISLEKIRNN